MSCFLYFLKTHSRRKFRVYTFTRSPKNNISVSSNATDVVSWFFNVLREKRIKMYPELQTLAQDQRLFSYKCSVMTPTPLIPFNSKQS